MTTVWEPVPGWKGYELSSDYELRHEKKPKALYFNKGYVKFNHCMYFFGRPVWGYQLFHRIVGKFVYNPVPSVLKILDHIDGDTQNNKRENLRWINQALNLLNQRNAVGVRKFTRRGRTLYLARCKQHRIGYFDTHEEAHHAYNRYREKEYARLYKQILDDNDVSESVWKHPDVVRASTLKLP